MISLIVACSKNGVIGDKGDLPWKMSSDLKYFKEKTINNIIVMGKNTFLSLPKLLPNRETWLISQERLIDKTFSSIEEVLSYYKVLQELGDKRELIFVGGARIYQEALKHVNTIYLTRINAIVAGDTFFNFNEEGWTLLSENCFWKDEKNQYDYSFLVYEKIK